jgi:hypothetical protein
MSTSIVMTRDAVVNRLCERFAGIPAATVHRCVEDLWFCFPHLGARPDVELVERLAASRLMGVVLGARMPGLAR